LLIFDALAEFMNLVYCSGYREMSRLAAVLVLQTLSAKPDLLLCAATGSSPEGLYTELAGIARGNMEVFRQMRVLKLDEWGGIPENHPVSCEYYLREKLLDPLGIPEERYFAFRSDPMDPEEECRRIGSLLASEGPIDICILGLGQNGHLGLNEPAPELEPDCHVAGLTKESLQHPMIASLDNKPTYGLTLGMQGILSSRQIIILVSGKQKKVIAGKFLEGKLTSKLPASYLWHHQQTECLLDRTILD
jgi:galactosamine-6-phosphate isomerase